MKGGERVRLIGFFGSSLSDACARCVVRVIVFLTQYVLG